jgi:hypothetical protein
MLKRDLICAIYLHTLFTALELNVFPCFRKWQERSLVKTIILSSHVLFFLDFEYILSIIKVSHM